MQPEMEPNRRNEQILVPATPFLQRYEGPIGATDADGWSPAVASIRRCGYAGHAANVTKRLWEIGDIVDVLEAWEQSGCARG
jgi:hypothetical protein